MKPTTMRANKPVNIMSSSSAEDHVAHPRPALTIALNQLALAARLVGCSGLLDRYYTADSGAARLWAVAHAIRSPHDSTLATE